MSADMGETAGNHEYGQNKPNGKHTSPFSPRIYTADKGIGQKIEANFDVSSRSEQGDMTGPGHSVLAGQKRLAHTMDDETGSIVDTVSACRRVGQCVPPHTAHNKVCVPHNRKKNVNVTRSFIRVRNEP